MAKVVIDASLAAAWCLPDKHTEYTNGVLRAVGTSVDPMAPVLWGYEIHNTLLMSFKCGRITREDVERLLLFLEELDVQLVNSPSYGTLLHLADAHALTVYDAAYLDLALREGAAIATLDKALRSAAQKAGVPLFEIARSSEK